MIKISRLKRLRRKSKLNIKCGNSRLKRKIIAEWTQVNPQDEQTIQLLTDSMSFGYPVQIDYEGSGWRTIQPYGWNTSKEGNILLMCYKDNGEVRSYRMDRINDLYIDMDSSGGIVTNNNPSMNDDNDLDLFMQNVYDSNETTDINNYEESYPYDMPSLPENVENNIDMSPGIYDEELDILQNDNYMDPQSITPEQFIEQPIEQVPESDNDNEIVEPDNNMEEINKNDISQEENENNEQ